MRRPDCRRNLSAPDPARAVDQDLLGEGRTRHPGGAHAQPPHPDRSPKPYAGAGPRPAPPRPGAHRTPAVRTVSPARCQCPQTVSRHNARYSSRSRARPCAVRYQPRCSPCQRRRTCGRRVRDRPGRVLIGGNLPAQTARPPGRGRPGSATFSHELDVVAVRSEHDSASRRESECRARAVAEGTTSPAWRYPSAAGRRRSAPCPRPAARRASDRVPGRYAAETVHEWVDAKHEHRARRRESDGGACHRPSIAHAIDRPGLSTVDAANLMSDPIAAVNARIIALAGTFCSCVP